MRHNLTSLAQIGSARGHGSWVMGHGQWLQEVVGDMAEGGGQVRGGGGGGSGGKWW